MRARVLGLLNALLLRNAPATEREFSVLRTSLDFTALFSFVLNVAFRFAFCLAFRPEFVRALVLTDLLGVLRVAADRLRVLRAVVRATLPLELDRADEWDIARLELTCEPPPRAPPPACAPPPPPPPTCPPPPPLACGAPPPLAGGAA